MKDRPPNRACPECKAVGRDKDDDHLYLHESGEVWICAKSHIHTSGKAAIYTADELGVPTFTMEDDIRIDDTPAAEAMFSKDLLTLAPPGFFDTFRGIPRSVYDLYGCKIYANRVTQELAEVRYPITTKGERIGVKTRRIPKDFICRVQKKHKKDPKDFFGIRTFKGRRRILITGGEQDAMAAYHMLSKYEICCLSVPTGESLTPFKDHLDFLNKCDELFYCPDNDEAGKVWLADLALLIPHIKIVEVPPLFKDANECLEEGAEGAFVNAFFAATPYKPDSIVKVSDIKECLREKPAFGMPTPWEAVTELTHGILPHEIYSIGAGAGIGKTSYVRAIQLGLLYDDEPVVIMSLEESAQQTLRYLVGYQMNKKIWLPGIEYDPDEAISIAEEIQKNLFIYDCSYFAGDFSNIETAIRLMAVSGVTKFFIDPVSALTVHLSASDANTYLNNSLLTLSRLVQSRPLSIFLINHLNNPTSGKGHDEGGRVKPSQFTGSKSIWRFSTSMVGIERDTLSEDITVRNTSIIRCLKLRVDGGRVGNTAKLYYNGETGRMVDNPDFFVETLVADDDEIMF